MHALIFCQLLKHLRWHRVAWFGFADDQHVRCGKVTAQLCPCLCQLDNAFIAHEPPYKADDERIVGDREALANVSPHIGVTRGIKQRFSVDAVACTMPKNDEL